MAGWSQSFVYSLASLPASQCSARACKSTSPVNCNSETKRTPPNQDPRRAERSGVERMECPHVFVCLLSALVVGRSLHPLLYLFVTTTLLRAPSLQLLCAAVIVTAENHGTQHTTYQSTPHLPISAKSSVSRCPAPTEECKLFENSMPLLLFSVVLWIGCLLAVPQSSTRGAHAECCRGSK